jgi:hypothetical protein
MHNSGGTTGDTVHLPQIAQIGFDRVNAFGWLPVGIEHPVAMLAQIGNNRAA